MADEAKHGATTASIPPMPPLTRREFLNYAWLASLGFVFVGGTSVATFFFSLPRFKEGEFGGVFRESADQLPGPNDPPRPNREGKYWLANLNGNVIALYNVCVHLGCLYEWQPVTGRFECPCHGSKYHKDGTYIEGPAPRSLDRMKVTFAQGSQSVAASERGEPLAIPADKTLQLVVDTGKITQGNSHG
jgi:cytochrome b6-f complex iron-sulfur subunit